MRRQLNFSRKLSQRIVGADSSRTPAARPQAPGILIDAMDHHGCPTTFVQQRPGREASRASTALSTPLTRRLRQQRNPKRIDRKRNVRAIELSTDLYSSVGQKAIEDVCPRTRGSPGSRCKSGRTVMNGSPDRIGDCASKQGGPPAAGGPTDNGRPRAPQPQPDIVRKGARPLRPLHRSFFPFWFTRQPACRSTSFSAPFCACACACLHTTHEREGDGESPIKVTRHAPHTAFTYFPLVPSSSHTPLHHIVSSNLLRCSSRQSGQKFRLLYICSFVNAGSGRAGAAARMPRATSSLSRLSNQPPPQSIQSNPTRAQPKPSPPV